MDRKLKTRRCNGDGDVLVTLATDRDDNNELEQLLLFRHEAQQLCDELTAILNADTKKRIDG